MKKLWKYINESDEGLSGCYVCGNILYLNALEIAAKFAVPLVINGYSKGQAAMVNDKEQGSFLLEKVIEVVNKTGDKEFFNEFIGKYRMVDKKIAYEKKEDLEKEVDPDKILVIPFYVFDFYKTDKEELKEKLCRRFDWQPLQTSYPSRTTNCEMVWLCSYMDRKKMGYSMYEIEYSELIRRGEFTREQACRDLEFNPPPGLLERLATEVGVDLNRFDRPAKTPAHKSQVKEQEIDFDL